MDPLCNALHDHRLDPIEAVRRPSFAGIPTALAALHDGHLLARRAAEIAGDRLCIGGWGGCPQLSFVSDQQPRPPASPAAPLQPPLPPHALPPSPHPPP